MFIILSFSWRSRIMSHVAYDLQLSDAMNDLQEQVKVEHAPTDKNEHGVEVS